MSQASEQIARQFANALANTKTPWGSILINPKEYGAKGDGVTDDTAAIQAAISAATVGEQIVFPDDGVYLISSPIVLNKKVPLISWNGATIKAAVPMEALIKCTGFTSYADMHISGFYLRADNKADYCILLYGSGAVYTTKTVIENCDIRDAVLDGINITPPAWSITIRNTLSNSHGRDGIRAIMTTDPNTNQVNHVLIDGCTLNDNTGEGINILGVANTIRNCDIENNNYGIRIDASQSSGSYGSHLINIVGNYIEGNRSNQVYLRSENGDGLYINMNQNYLNPRSTSGATIRAAGAVEAVNLIYRENRYETSTSNTVIDGGNALNSKSIIEDDVYLKESRFINLGYARVMWDRFKTMTFPLTTSRGATLTAFDQTANIIPLTPKQITVASMNDLTQCFLQSVSMPIVSDCSTVSIRIVISEYDLATKTNSKQTLFDITSANNAVLTATIANNWGFYRIPTGKMIILDFIINSYTGTYLYFNTPYLQYL